MRLPKPAPELTPERLVALLRDPQFKHIGTLVPDGMVGGKYLHWDELQHRTPPPGLTHDRWWDALSFRREAARVDVPLLDKSGHPFWYTTVDPVPRWLHAVDRMAGDVIGLPDPIANQQTRDTYCIRSLIHEAISSSQLEGASTTRQVAKEMLRTGRSPRNRSERMIVNNFQLMQRIREVKDGPLSRDLVFELHRIATAGTMADERQAGRLRRGDEAVHIFDLQDETVVHTPPPADALPDRLDAMCAFANGTIPAIFVHPALRSIILHFWLAYDHPFVDGNGRTARALFYWSMLHHGYWLFEQIHVSTVIQRARTKYDRAFLFTERGNNDLTYFIVYHLNVVEQALKDLHAYIDRKSRETRAAEQVMRARDHFNVRQKALLSHALRHPDAVYGVEGHRRSHGTVYETARTDLLDLAGKGLLLKGKTGRVLEFRVPRDLEQRLRQPTGT